MSLPSNFLDALAGCSSRARSSGRSCLFAAITLAASGTLAAGEPDARGWPGFRGEEMSGLAPQPLPEKWSATENVRWVVPIPGRGWSSPIVWKNVVYITSASGARPFKAPSTGIYGNDYVAELHAQGLPDDEVLRRLRARDIESSAEAEALRYAIHAFDARTGKRLWTRDAYDGTPFGGRHRKNTYASETPATDGERLYVSFGQNVGLFCFTLDGKPLWKKQWTPQHIYLDFGTGSSPTVHGGRVYMLHDGEDQSYITALDAKTGRELWKTERAAVGFPKSSWMTPFVWKNAQRTEIVTTGHGFVISYDLEGKELWRIAKMAMPIVSPVSANGLLYVGTGSQGDANRPMYAIRPGASGDISLGEGATSSEHIVWSHPRASGYTPSALVYQNRVYLVHDTGILLVLDALTGKEVYKARVGGGGNTFSASPIGAGGRVYLLNEDGATFVLDAGADEYKELGKNDLGEMSLASPAAAGGALYIRTQTKLYRIGG